MHGLIRILLLSGVLLLGLPVALRGQQTPTAERPGKPRAHVGVFVGLLGERTRLDGKRADALEEESGRFGLLYGLWSVGYSEKRIEPGFLVSTGSAPLESARLRLQGIEVGRVLSTKRFVQPAVYLTVSRGTVQRDVLTGMLVRVRSDRERVTMLEPAVSAGIPIWRVARAELRAGMRLGPTVTFDTTSLHISTSGAFVSAMMSVGWFGDWSRGWVW